MAAFLKRPALLALAGYTVLQSAFACIAPYLFLYLGFIPSVGGLCVAIAFTVIPIGLCLLTLRHRKVWAVSLPLQFLLALVIPTLVGGPFHSEGFTLEGLLYTLFIEILPVVGMGILSFGQYWRKRAEARRQSRTK